MKLLTGRVDVTTNVIWQGNIDASEPLSRDAGVIADVSKRLRATDDVSPLLQREVDLCDASGVPLCYAASWWNLNASRDIVLDADAENGFGALDRPVQARRGRRFGRQGATALRRRRLPVGGYGRRLHGEP